MHIQGATKLGSLVIYGTSDSRKQRLGKEVACISMEVNIKTSVVKSRWEWDRG
jgi:hypothetical protein